MERISGAIKYTVDKTIEQLNLKPVIDERNVPCFYDSITGQYYYNKGTGDFIPGPVISEYFK